MMSQAMEMKATLVIARMAVKMILDSPMIRKVKEVVMMNSHNKSSWGSSMREEEALNNKKQLKDLFKMPKRFKGEWVCIKLIKGMRQPSC